MGDDLAVVGLPSSVGLWLGDQERRIVLEGEAEQPTARFLPDSPGSL